MRKIVHILLAATLFWACKGYKTPTPEAINTPVDGFEKFASDSTNVFIIGNKIITKGVINGSNTTLDGAIKLTATPDNVWAKNKRLVVPSNGSVFIYDTESLKLLGEIEGVASCSKLYLADSLLYILKGVADCPDSASANISLYNLEAEPKLVSYWPLKDKAYDMAFSDRGILLSKGAKGVGLVGITALGIPRTEILVGSQPSFWIDTNNDLIWSRDLNSLTQFTLSAEQQLIPLSKLTYK